jgi:hypothetical protein
LPLAIQLTITIKRGSTRIKYRQQTIILQQSNRKPMEYNFEFCFRRGTISASDIYNIYNNQLSFQPNRINFSKFEKKENITEQTIKSFLEEENKIRFDTITLDGGVLDFWKKKHDYLSWISTLDFPTTDFINQKVSEQGFLYLHIYRLHFVLMQNETLLNNYHAFNEPYDHLKIFKDIDGQEYVDTSNNPGRSWFDQESGFNFLACWKMWLSKEVQDHFTGKPIEHFPYAYKIEKLKNDVLFVQLYENVEDSKTADALKAMQAFRDWVQMP